MPGFPTRAEEISREWLQATLDASDALHALRYAPLLAASAVLLGGDIVFVTRESSDAER